MDYFHIVFRKLSFYVMMFLNVYLFSMFVQWSCFSKDK